MNTDIVDASSAHTFNNFGNYAISNGVLTSVMLEVAIDETVTSLFITSAASISERYTYSTSASDQINGSAPAADLTNLNNALLFSVNLFSTGVQTIASGGTQTFIPPPAGGVSVTNDTGLITAVSNAPYAPAGFFTISYDTLTSETLAGGGGNVTAHQATISSADYTVVYNYDIVALPEPASLALTGAALMGLAFIRRRRA